MPRFRLVGRLQTTRPDFKVPQGSAARLYLSGVISFMSPVSMTKTARRLAGSVSLAFSLTMCRAPDSSKKALADLVDPRGVGVDPAADGSGQYECVDEGGTVRADGWAIRHPADG